MKTCKLSSEWGGEKVNVDNLLKILAAKRGEMERW